MKFKGIIWGQKIKGKLMEANWCYFMFLGNSFSSKQNYQRINQGKEKPGEFHFLIQNTPFLEIRSVELALKWSP